MDDAADGDLIADEWSAQPAQMALVYTNLLATLPHLAAGDDADAEFHRRLAGVLLTMSLGQFADLESAAAVYTICDYLDLIAMKTGAEAAFFAAAPLLLAGAPTDACDAWSSFGMQIGCMAQMFSDVYGTFTTKAHNDLLDGKRTLPVLYTFERLTGTELNAFRTDLDAVASGAAARLPAVFARMHACGAAQGALREVERLRYRAAVALPTALSSLTGDHPVRQLLRCCSVLRDGTLDLSDANTLGASVRAPSTLQSREPAPVSRTDVQQAARVADYYDTNTDKFYMRLWDVEDIHFGLFDSPRRITLRDALKAMTRAIVAPAGMRAGDFIVDAGCGVGGAALDLARDEGVRVLGLTLSPRQVEIARERTAAAELGDRVHFAVADCAELLPIEDGSVDIVLTIEAACHFANRARFVEECHRVLRPGGCLVGSDWVRTAPASDEAAETALQALESAWRLSSLASIDEWRQLLEQGGFHSARVEDFGADVQRNAPYAGQRATGSMARNGAARCRAAQSSTLA